MESRKASWYSIVRYYSSDLTGEIVNVGIILHSVSDKITTRYLLIDEQSAKIKAITNSHVDVNVYKSYKDTIEYYLKESCKNTFGDVGDLQISSTLDDRFLLRLYEFYSDKKLFLTKPKFSMATNLDALFNNLFESYVGKKYLLTDHKSVGVKKYMRQVFREKQLLDKKVAHDFSITPIEGLDNIKINIDFGYKNGVWNFLQVIPSMTGPTKNTEWFAKTKFMFENLDKETKVHLLYRSSEMDNKKEFMNMYSYLSHLKESVLRLDLDNSEKVEQLCTIIEKDAHENVEELLLA